MTCASCGNTLRPGAKFCDECGTPTRASTAAEYKQVTVLFADVVHSMDIAAAVGPERLREIMAELVTRSTVVVQRYGGTVDKFTGDGIMALFGAPVALEEHAFRACLAALAIQRDVQQLAAEVEGLDKVSLRLRIGLNSGQVIAGGVGSGPMAYTAIGEQVGMAQRMESVAPAGGVMVSESTARLVEHAVELGETEWVRIKGSSDEVPARRLISAAVKRHRPHRTEPTLVGRNSEIDTIAEILDRAASGTGCVVSIVGSPGIGKSRLVQESGALAASRGMEVAVAYCESHACDVPFHAFAHVLQAAMGIDDLDDKAARARVRALMPDADPEDLLLLDDLMGIADIQAARPPIEPDAWRRRLTQLVNAEMIAPAAPSLLVLEDAHWIDDVSDSMLAGFASVIPQSRMVALVTYRPEYRGVLAGLSGARGIGLLPLGDQQCETLVHELLGPHPSVHELAHDIADRAAGNPFFAEEMVRDLAGRNLLEGKPGQYVLCGNIADVSVPATLQATIAARIDRLPPPAKQTLCAAAVVGSRFGPDLLLGLGIDPAFEELVTAELIDQVRINPTVEYQFRHPLIRTVAYESQLKSTRAQLHRRLAGVIETRRPEAADENAALIAEHLEAAGNLRDAFGWHMRAGIWLTNRDIVSARVSWQRARQIADGLPEADPGRVAMRIASRTSLCLSAFRVGGRIADTGFDELRELATAAGDTPAIVMAMVGQVSALILRGRVREACQLASEYTSLVESMDDPTLTVALIYAALGAKSSGCEVHEVIRLSERIIDLVGDRPSMGNLMITSPLAGAFIVRGAARAFLGDSGWQQDLARGAELASTTDLTTRAILMGYRYGCVVNGAVPIDAEALRDTAEMLSAAERFGDDLTLAIARYVRGLALVRRDGPEREDGFALLAMAREAALNERFTMIAVQVIDLHVARERLRNGDVDGAVELSRAVVEDQIDTGEMTYRGPAVTVLVESLLRRGTSVDVEEAGNAVDRLEATEVDPGFVLYELHGQRLRALLARARGDEVSYRDFAKRYQAMANSLAFEEHIAVAESM